VNVTDLHFQVGQTVRHRLNKTPMLIIDIETGMRKICLYM
jgi:heat shock protein HspQ